MGMELSVAVMKNSMKYPRNRKILSKSMDLPPDPAFSLLVICLKGMKFLYQRHTYTPMLIEA